MAPKNLINPEYSFNSSLPLKRLSMTFEVVPLQTEGIRPHCLVGSHVFLPLACVKVMLNFLLHPFICTWKTINWNCNTICLVNPFTLHKEDHWTTFQQVWPVILSLVCSNTTWNVPDLVCLTDKLKRLNRFCLLFVQSYPLTSASPHWTKDRRDNTELIVFLHSRSLEHESTLEKVAAAP